MKDLGKILTRISDNLGKILASMARLNNLGKILVISWQDLAKISVLPRPCHDLPRSGKILQDLAKIFNLGRASQFQNDAHTGMAWMWEGSN